MAHNIDNDPLSPHWEPDLKQNGFDAEQTAALRARRDHLTQVIEDLPRFSLGQNEPVGIGDAETNYIAAVRAGDEKTAHFYNEYFGIGQDGYKWREGLDPLTKRALHKAADAEITAITPQQLRQEARTMRGFAEGTNALWREMRAEYPGIEQMYGATAISAAGERVAASTGLAFNEIVQLMNDDPRRVAEMVKAELDGGGYSKAYQRNTGRELQTTGYEDDDDRTAGISGGSNGYPSHGHKDGTSENPAWDALVKDNQKHFSTANIIHDMQKKGGWYR